MSNKSRDQILVGASNGNADALAFLRAFARRAHWIDDLADRDQVPIEWNWYPPEKFAEEEANWLATIAGNQFFLTYRAQLIPAMTLALSAWADSERFPCEQQSVLKGQWHEVVWLVAWLTGGWAGLRAACLDREFDVDLGQPTEIPIKKGANGTLRS